MTQSSILKIVTSPFAEGEYKFERNSFYFNPSKAISLAILDAKIESFWDFSKINFVRDFIFFRRSSTILSSGSRSSLILILEPNIITPPALAQ